MIENNKLANLYLSIIRGGILLIIFLPLFVYEKFLFPFVFPKTIVFRIIIELILIFYLLLIVSKPEYRPRKSILLILITAFVGIMLITSLLGVDFYHSFWSSIERSEGILTWLHLLIFFIILISTLKTKKDWLTILNTVIIAAWLQALYALSQFFKLPFILTGFGERISGSFGNPSFLASYLILIIFIAAYLSTQYQLKKAKIYYFIFILINVFLLWHAQTRGAILSFVIGLLLFIIIKLWQQPRIKTKIILAIFIIIILTSGFLLISNKDTDWIKSSTTLRRLTNISTTDITSQNRLIVWGVGLKGFLERPLLGWGWENFNVAFNKYFNPLIARDVGSRPWYDRAHNVIVETGVATGIFGLLAYLSIFVWAIKILWQKKGIKQNENLFIIILLLAYLFQNIFVFDTLNSYIIFFMILAFIQSQKESVFLKNKTQKIWFNKVQNKKTGIYIFITLIIVILPIIYFFNIRPTLANYYTVRAVTVNKNISLLSKQNFEHAFTYSPPNDQELRFILVQHTRDQLSTKGITQENLPLIELAITEMNKSIQASPDAIQNYLILAELYLTTSKIGNNLELAENITKKALARAPKRYQTYTMLGRIKMSQGQFYQGVDYFKQAIELNENFAEAHWNLAIAYILIRQNGLAEAEFEKMRQLNFDIYQPKNAEKILEAYRDSKDLLATINFLEKLVNLFPDNLDYQKLLADLEKLYQQVLEEAQQE